MINRNQKRLHRFIFFCCILVMSFFFACSQSQDEKTPNTKNKSQEAKTIKIAVNAGPEGNAIKRLAPEFKNAKIELIELAYQPLREQLISSLRDSFTDFDVIMIDDPWFPQLAMHLSQIDGAPKTLIDDIVKPSLDLCKDPYGSGKLYAMPYVGNTQLLFYRKDIIDELGIAKIPNNWEELAELSTKIYKGRTPKESDKKYFGYCIRGRVGAPIVTDFLPIYWSLGGGLVDNRGTPSKEAIDKDKFLKALKIYNQLKESSPPGASNFDWSEMTAAFTNGQAVFQLNWPAAIEMINANLDPQKGEKWGILSPPGSSTNTDTGTSMIGNWLLAIPKDSKKKVEAEEFIIWLMEKQKEVASEGNPPTRKSVFNAISSKEGLEYFKTIQEALVKSTPRVRSEKWAQIEDSVSRSVSGFLSGNFSEEVAFENLQIDLKKLFGEPITQKQSVQE